MAKRVTEEEYQKARKAKEEAEKVLEAFFKQEADDFDARWAAYESGEKFFTEEEIRYSAGARCEQCNAGLAYPLNCGGHHHWSCSAQLKGEIKEKHHTFAFAFWSIKSEDQPSAQGHTTRPK